MKSAFGITIGKIAGFIIFLILLAILNSVNTNVQNATIGIVTDYLNSSIMIVAAFSLLFLLAELFAIFSFPFNLSYPIWNALASIFLIMFLFNFMVVFPFYDTAPKAILEKIGLFIYILVPFLVLISGYAKIFFPKKERRRASNWEDEEHGDIGEEVKGLILDVIRKMRQGLK